MSDETIQFASDRAKGRKFRYLTRNSASVLTLMVVMQAAHPALAQEKNAAPVEQVVVTGSRLITNGVDAPTPVTVVNTEDLKSTSPGDFAGALEQLPVLANSTNVTSQTISFAGGQSYLNLRGLGTSRTLTLLDGQRMVPANVQGLPDINLIPDAMISRTDIVTGGASAAYGSDAVAGVVNFILDNNFTGIKGYAQGGISDHDDGANEQVSLTAGGNFFSDRLHVVLSAEYKHQDTIYEASRSWLMNDVAVISNPNVTSRNPASPTNPSRIISNNVQNSAGSLGGLIVGGPLNGTQFAPNGTPEPFDFGTDATTSTQVGGSGVNGNLFGELAGGLTQAVSYTHADYNFSDDFSVFAQAQFAHDVAPTTSSDPNRETGTAGYNIFSTNAYLPASIKTAMTADHITSFSLGRISADFGRFWGTTEEDTYNFVGGFHALIRDWTVDGYAESGQETEAVHVYNDAIYDKLFLASNAVVNPASGQIVCASTLNPITNNPYVAAEAVGCQPLDVFGNGSPSPSALKYILGSEIDHVISQQNVFDVSAHGEPFSLWAGPVGFAFGGTYRTVSARQTEPNLPINSEVLSNASIPAMPSGLNGKLGGFELNDVQPLAGRISVGEGFLETDVPLARDEWWAKSLSFDAAGRFTDYSQSGAVTTWKLGLVYQPIEDLRLRVTGSEDIRAPNISELYTAATVGGLAVTDPLNNNRVNPGGYGYTTGNPNLKPEDAHQITAGATYQPSWLPGFSGSVDYYLISVAGEITSIGAQAIVNDCYQGQTSLCALITRDPSTGYITAIQNPLLNIANAVTDGVDLEADYQAHMSDFVSNWVGDLRIRLLSTFLDNLKSTTPGTAGDVTINRAGDISNTQSPHWRASLTANYDLNAWGVVVRERYIGAGLFDSTFNFAKYGFANAISNNDVGAVWYTDATVNYRFGTDFDREVYFTVNNVFNRNPAADGLSSFSVEATQPIGKTLYDMIGRTYTLGIRFHL
jgi:outer membrane receptor protein involved in Fe transport